MSKFKVGDRVRILDDNKSEITVGTFGTIEEDSNSENEFTVRCDEDKDFWYFKSEHLELADPSFQQVLDLLDNAQQSEPLTAKTWADLLRAHFKIKEKKAV